MTDQNVLGGVTVEVKTNLSPLDQGFSAALSKSKAFDKQASQDMGNVAQAATAMGATTATAAKRAGGALQDMADQINAAETAMAAEAREAINAAAATGKFGSDARRTKSDLLALSDAAGRARREAMQLAREARRGGDGIKHISDQAKLGKGQLANLSYQLNDVISGLLQGQSVMQISTQQGGQLVQILGQGPGGIGGSLRALLGLLNPAVVGLLAVAGAIGVGAAAGFSNAKALEEAGVATMGAGAAAGLTAEQFLALAHGAAEAGNVSKKAAEDIGKGMLNAGVVSEDVLTRMIALQKAYAIVTRQDAKDATAELARAMADPINGVELLDQKLNFLDDTTKQHIISLARQNDITGAQIALSEALQGKLLGVTDKVNGLAQAWAWVAKTASDAWTAMGKKFASPDGDRDQQIADLNNRIAAARKGGLFGRVPAGIVGLEQRRDKLVAEKVGEQLTADLNEDRAKANLQSKAEGEALRRLNPLDEQRNRILADRTIVQKALAAGTMDRAKGETALAKATRDLAQLDKKESGAKTPSHSRADTLKREAEAMDESTKGALALAGAYLVSGEAAFKAESRRQALTRAARSGADAEAQVRRQMALDVAEATAGGAKMLRQTLDQTAAQKSVNDQVAAGTLNTAQATAAMRDEAQLRPLLVAEAAAEGDAKKRLTDIIARLRDQQKASNAEDNRSAVLASVAAQKEANRTAEVQLSLIGKTNRERARALALLKAQQELTRRGTPFDSPEGKALIGEALKGADTQSNTDAGQYIDTVTKRLKAQQDEWDRVRATMGMTREEAGRYRLTQELLNGAIEAGIDLTPDQVHALELMADGYAKAEEAAKRLELQQAKAAERSGFLAESFADAVTSMVLDGKKGEDALKDLVRAMARAALQAMLLGTGPFAGANGQGQNGQGGGLMGGVVGGLFGYFKGGWGGALQGFTNGYTGQQSGAPPGGAAPAAGSSGFNVGAIVAHQGQMNVGLSSPSSTRSVPASTFINAPRHHNGLLGPREHAAILEEGENVLTKDQTAALMRNRGGTVNRTELTVNLKGANGDQTIKRIAGQAAAGALRAAQKAAPSRDVQYRMLGT